jgi:hypothetical protein
MITPELLDELDVLADAVNRATVARIHACRDIGDRSCGQALAAEQAATDALAEAMTPAVVQELAGELRRSLREGAYLRDELAKAREYRVDACRFGVLRRLFSLESGVFLLKGDEDGEPDVMIGVPTEAICYSRYAGGSDLRAAVDEVGKRMSGEGKML